MLVSDQHFMVKQNVLIEGGTVFDNIYGCAKNIDVQLTSICSFCCCCQNIVSIDQDIGEPVHGKYLVDGLNACDKKI